MQAGFFFEKIFYKLFNNCQGIKKGGHVVLKGFSLVDGKNKVNLNFYRDNKMKEIDLIIEENGILHPAEIKKSSAPDKSTAKAFSVLKSTERPIGTGVVICMSDVVLPLDESNLIVPSNLI